jgi:hypothetical protein
MIYSLLGLASLIVSLGIAWTLTHVSGVRRVNGVGMMSILSFVLFIIGVVACWFGVIPLLSLQECQVDGIHEGAEVVETGAQVWERDELEPRQEEACADERLQEQA